MSVILNRYTHPMFEYCMSAHAMERLGSYRVLFGDDIPCGQPSWELEKGRASGINDEELRLLLGENTRSLYNLD